MVICLCGIFAHIIRKTLATEEKKSVPKLNLNELSSSSDDDDNGKELFRPRLIPSKTKFDGIPLLDDTDDSDNGLSTFKFRENSVKLIHFISRVFWPGHSSEKRG